MSVYDKFWACFDRTTFYQTSPSGPVDLLWTKKKYIGVLFAKYVNTSHTHISLLQVNSNWLFIGQPVEFCQYTNMKYQRKSITIQLGMQCRVIPILICYRSIFSRSNPEIVFSSMCMHIWICRYIRINIRMHTCSERHTYRDNCTYAYSYPIVSNIFLG